MKVTSQATKRSRNRRLLNLRARAEAALPSSSPEVARMTLPQMKRLVHELQVHQVELQMQNEELRQAQAELAAAHDRFCDLYDFAPVGYLSVGAGAVILQANLTFARMLGVPREALIGKKLHRFVHAESQDELYHHMLAVLEGDAVCSCELMLCRADGKTFPAQLETIYSKDPDGPASCRCVVTDISGRHELEREVLRISEMEQARIGHDLHDGIGQTLTGIASLVEALELSAQGELRTGAQRVREILQQAVIEVRRLSHGLSPLAIRNRGLSGALQLLSDTVQESYRTRCELEVDPNVTVNDAETETHLFRIAQEAANNAMRHGQATRISISLTRDPDGAHGLLRITDNGKGLKQIRTGQDGIGLRLMAYRAKQLKGSLVVKPRPRGGVSVICRFPCQGGHENLLRSR